LSPIKAAVARGTARNRLSSQKPACAACAIADSEGRELANMSGLTKVSDGVHQPSFPCAKKYKKISYAKNGATSRYPVSVFPAIAREDERGRDQTFHNCS